MVKAMLRSAQVFKQCVTRCFSTQAYKPGFAPNLFENRVCVISGGNGGIGRECARLITSLGGRVALLSRSKQRAEHACHTINESVTDRLTHAECRGYECDVTNEQSIKQAITEIRSDLGEINVLICSHGISMDAVMASSSIGESINQSINVNLIGSLQLARAVHRSMMRSLPKQSNQSLDSSIPPTNSIVFVSSVIASRGNVGQVAYAASKAGLTGAVKSLSKEWFARHSVRVNCVEPGLVDTDMLEEKQRERFINEQSTNQPNFRIAHPAEIANVCAFLSSDLASYITGTSIEVSGGLR